MLSRQLNGVNTFAPNSPRELIDYAFEHKSILIAVNAEKILHATDETRSIINRNVGYPDGIGAVWALRNNGCKEVKKISGVELWLEIIRKYQNQKTFYLVGGKNNVIEQTVIQLKKEFPKIQILNYRDGYMKDKKDREILINDIRQKKPDVVFVAMGSPKQELLMEEIQRTHPAVYQGLGGSFDVYTGNVKRAPSWWIENNLEWAYRLLSQPSRIRRQVHLIRFFIKLKMNSL